MLFICFDRHLRRLQGDVFLYEQKLGIYSNKQNRVKTKIKIQKLKLTPTLVCINTINIENFFIGIQPLGRSGQRPELSQVTAMALARCILGRFLGVLCHCFPSRLDVPTFATRCPHVRHDARDPSSGRWNCGREYCPVILPK
jgi:hypothetical protein